MDFFSSLGNLMKHMKEKHPDSKYFGDSCWGTLDGEIKFQRCQLCGEELAENGGSYEDRQKANQQ